MRSQVSSVGKGHDVTDAANDSSLRYRFPGASDDQSLLALSAAHDSVRAGIHLERTEETDARW